MEGSQSLQGGWVPPMAEETLGPANPQSIPQSPAGAILSDLNVSAVSTEARCLSAAMPNSCGLDGRPSLAMEALK